MLLPYGSRTKLTLVDVASAMSAGSSLLAVGHVAGRWARPKSSCFSVGGLIEAAELVTGRSNFTPRARCYM